MASKKHVLLGSLLSAAVAAGGTAAMRPAPPRAAPALSAEAHFSPRGGCTAALVAAIDGAKKSLRGIDYNFTSQPVAEAFARAVARGVDTELVFDRSVVTEKASQLPALLAARVPVWIDSKHAITHDKYLVVDGKDLLTGSFNWTPHAEEANAENLLTLHGVPGLAMRYTLDFDLHKGHSDRAK